MGTVHRLRLSRTPTVGAAIGACLAALEHPENAGTRRVYAVTLHQLRTHLGDDQPVAVLNETDTAQQCRLVHLAVGQPDASDVQPQP